VLLDSAARVRAAVKAVLLTRCVRCEVTREEPLERPARLNFLADFAAEV
jgi:hypothetical protein